MSQTKAQLIDPTDGSIVNADINASAAIAGTKISPDFGSQAISTTGGIQLNGASVDISEKIKHIGDLDTFISFPANDTIGLTTANTERIRIASNGRVGIGDTSPDTPLHVKSADNVLATFESTDADALIEFKDSGTSDNILMGALGGDDFLLRCDAGNIIFNLGDNSEKARFDSSGRLLIGTTTEGVSTGDDLTIATSGNTGITIRSGTSSNGNIFFSDGTTGNAELEGYIQYDHSGNYMRFATGATERMRIDSDGRFLLAKGTANTTTSQVQIGDSAGGYSWDVGDVPQVLIAGINNEAPTNGGALNIAFRVQDENSSTVFQISNNGGGDSDIGRVGIGTPSPDRQLHVEGNGTAIIRLTDNDTTGEVGSIVGMLEFETRDSNGAGVAANIRSEISDSTNGACKLAFSTGTPSTIGTKMELNSSGALTIAAQPCAVVTNATPAGSLDDGQNGVARTFDSTHISQGGMSITNTRSRITVPVTGTYLVTVLLSGGVSTIQGGDGIILRLRRNGANYPTDASHPVETFGSVTGMEWSFTFNLPVNLSASDYIEVCLDNIGNVVDFGIDRGYFSATLMH